MLKYGDDWVAAEGAKTEDAARRKSSQYPQYRMGETKKIVSNNPGDPAA